MRTISILVILVSSLSMLACGADEESSTADMAGADTASADATTADTTAAADQSAGETDAAATDAGGASVRIVEASTSFGECIGECRFTISFGPDGSVFLDVSEYVPGTPLRSNEGTLSVEGQARYDLDTQALASVTLMPVYGCPDCADGGASSIIIDIGGAITSHEYELGNPPPELTNIDELIQDVIDALNTCADNSMVFVDPVCDSQQP